MRNLMLVLALVMFMVAPAAAQTTLGAGVAFSDMDGVATENVIAFVDYAYPLDSGTSEVTISDDGSSEEVWYPNWYAGIGYSVKGADDPISMIYLPLSKRLGSSDAFFSVGPQVEFWNESLLGEAKVAWGGRIGMEIPGAELGGLPLRAGFSYVSVDGVPRSEFSLTGTN